MTKEEAKLLLIRPTVSSNVISETKAREIEAYNMAIEALAERTGEWIKATGMMPPEFHGHHCCSECGNFANMETPFGNREDLGRFCPNCGAIMIGGDIE